MNLYIRYFTDIMNSEKATNAMCSVSPGCKSKFTMWHYSPVKGNGQQDGTLLTYTQGKQYTCIKIESSTKSYRYNIDD